MSVLIFYLEFIYTSSTTYSSYLIFRSLASQQATLGDSSTIPYAVLVDCSDHRACLCSQPCSKTCRPVSMLCSRIVLTTEHIYVSNHARGLCQPPSTFTFPTVLGDSSITPYTVLKACFDHSLTTAYGLFFSITYELDSYTTEGQF